MWCRWCKACAGRTWRGEKVGQRHQEGHHLLRVPCLGDTWAPRSLQVPVGTDSERSVAIWCCIWCRDLGFLRLFFIVSQLFIILRNFTPLPFSWGQVSSSQVSISTARRRSDRQFRPVHAEYASPVCPRCNLHIQDQQLDSGRQVGKHDGGTGPSRERLWWSQQCSHPKATEGTRPKPHALRRSWMVHGGNRMVLRTEPFLATPAHWQPWRVRRSENTERTSSYDTGSFWRQNERSCIHPQKWCDSSDSTSEESLPWEGGELWRSSPSELAARRIGQISRVLEVLC